MKFFLSVFFSSLLLSFITTEVSASDISHGPNVRLQYDSTKVFLEQGLKELQSKNYEKAIGLISQYLAIHDLDEVAFIRRGDGYLALKMYPEALLDYEQASKIGHNNPEVPYRIGMVHAAMNELEKAEQSQLRALDMDAAYAPAYEQLGDIYMLKKDTAAAISYFKQALEANPNMDDLLFKVGGILLSQNKTDEAIEYFNTAIANKPGNADYYYNAGLAYFLVNDTANTVKYMELAVKINPNYGQGFYALASIYSNQGRYDEAIENYTKALKVPKSGLFNNYLLTRRGMLYVIKGDNEKAFKDYEDAINLSKADTMAYVGRGEILLLQEKDSLAFLDFNYALALNPNIPTALIHRGRIFFAMGMYEDAEKDFTRAVELAPDDRDALYALGLAYLDQDKSQDAIRYFDKVLKVDPKYYRVYENRGIAYYNLGFYRQAMADFDNAMKRDASLLNKLQPLYLDAKAKAGL
jgi:tetratricopeptide (TPR) repeat protein